MSRENSEQGGARRVLLKLSGEALKGDTQYGICPQVLTRVSQEIVEARKSGVEIAVVVGGGNIHRGIAGATAGMDRSTSDYMGMLATVMNALALQDALERHGVSTRVLSAIEMREVAEPYIRRRAIRHLEKNRVVIFAAGIGNPYFTTDTTAALRANEIAAHVILKATKVDGVYDSDPVKNPDAKRFDRLSHREAIQKELKVMDTAAISLCRDNHIDILVFDLSSPGQITAALEGDHSIGTIVSTHP